MSKNHADIVAARIGGGQVTNNPEKVRAAGPRVTGLITRQAAQERAGRGLGACWGCLSKADPLSVPAEVAETVPVEFGL